MPAPAALLDQVTLVVPAGRSHAAVRPLVDTLILAAGVTGESPPRLLLATGPNTSHDACPDEVASAWRAAGGLVDWIPVDAGHATALRNAAVDRVATPWTAFLDDDVLVDARYLQQLARLCASDEADAIQGVPFLCSNPDQPLAAREARNYEAGFMSYVSGDASVRLLDARNLLIRTATIRRHRFNEALQFAGEGQELATRLRAAGLRTAYRPELRVLHRNRETLGALLRQKYFHGRGRAQRIRLEGGLNGAYLRRYANRHFIRPVVQGVRREIDLVESAYRLLTNSIFWLGALREALKRP